MRIFLTAMLLISSFANGASGQPETSSEMRNVKFEVYQEACKNHKCERIPIKTGSLSVKLEAENSEYSWGVATENIGDKKLEYKVFVHLSRKGKQKYRLQASLTKSIAGKVAAFSSASVTTVGYISGLNMVLEPSEGNEPQVRSSLTLE